VGSHEKDHQLQHLLQETGIVSIEVDVVQLLDNFLEQPTTLLSQTLESVRWRTTLVKRQWFIPVVRLVFADVQARLEFGADVSSLLMDIVRGLPSDIGFLISKGITNDVLSNGLA